MTKFYPLLIFFLPLFVFPQSFNEDPERFPQFSECREVGFDKQELCFNTTLKRKIKEGFILPAVVAEENYRGEMVVLFEVTSDGDFQVNYINAAYPELKEELNRIFETLPKISPATYNSRPIDMQFRMPINIPLEAEEPSAVIEEENVSIVKAEVPESQEEIEITTEYEQIKPLHFNHPRLDSDINIPLSHEFYSRFEDEVNMVGTNFHSASKPFLFSEVKDYYDFEEELLGLQKPVTSWVGRKVWNEHLFKFQGEGYWFAIDFGLDVQVGKILIVSSM